MRSAGERRDQRPSSKARRAALTAAVDVGGVAGGDLREWLARRRVLGHESLAARGGPERAVDERVGSECRRGDGGHLAVLLWLSGEDRTEGRRWSPTLSISPAGGAPIARRDARHAVHAGAGRRRG